MQCFKCDQPAKGTCKFCGRGVCLDHMSQMPFILTIYIGKEQIPKAVVVADALYCGICRPQPEPIEMPEIF